MIGSASDMFQIGDGHSGYLGLEGDGPAGHLALGKSNPSEAVKKLGESVEQRYLQSFRIAPFDRHRSQGSASEPR